MRQPITPEELLTQWRLIRLEMFKRVAKSTPEEIQVISVMEFQLTKCIDELQQVLSGEYPDTDLLNIIRRINEFGSTSERNPPQTR